MQKLGKRSPSSMSRKKTQSTNNYTKEVIVRDHSQRGSSTQQRNCTQKEEVFDFSMERCLHKKGKSETNLHKN